MLLLTVCTLLPFAIACRDPGTPKNSRAFYNVPHPTHVTSGVFREATVVTYDCNEPYQLLGPRNRVCQPDQSWSPRGVPFCVVDVAVNKPAFQSSEADSGGPYFAVDGNISTCSTTGRENSPWWYLDLKGVYPVSIIRMDLVDANDNGSVVATVRVGNDSRPSGNIVCNVYSGLVKGLPVYLICASTVYGRYVSVQLATFSTLSLCDLAVYTEGDVPKPSAEAAWAAMIGMSGTIGLGIGSVVLVLGVMACCSWKKGYFSSCCKKDSAQYDTCVLKRSCGLEGPGFGSRYELAWEELSIQTSQAGKQPTRGSLVRSPSTLTIWPTHAPLTVSKV